MKKTNRLLSWLLVAAILVGITPAWAVELPGGNVPTLEVVTTATSAVAGDVIDVEIWLRDAHTLKDGVWNVTFTLNLPKGLELVPGSGCVDANFASVTGFMMPAFTEQSMVFTSLGALTSGYAGGDVPCMKFQCRVLDTARVGELTISLVNTDLSNGYDSVEASVVSATITVTSGEHGNPGIFPGDMNGDGIVNSRDAIIVLCSIAFPLTDNFTSEQKTAADVNHDGKITVRDAIRIMSAVAAKATDQL